MCEFISSDIVYHSSGCEHFTMIYECIEKCKTIVEINRFEQEIRDQSSEEIFFRSIIDKVLIDISDKSISLKKKLVVTPKIINVVSFFTLDNCLENRRITLGMNCFLIRLDSKYEIYFWSSDIITKIR
jgi:hypothetical protein